MQNNSSSEILGRGFRVPDHIVRREFVEETVVLNVKTGRYHGLNPTAAKMLEALEEAPTAADAAERLALAYEQPVDQVREDLVELCEAMIARGFIESAVPVDAHP